MKVHYFKRKPDTLYKNQFIMDHRFKCKDKTIQLLEKKQNKIFQDLELREEVLNDAKSMIHKRQN